MHNKLSVTRSNQSWLTVLTEHVTSILDLRLRIPVIKIISKQQQEPCLFLFGEDMLKECSQKASPQHTHRTIVFSVSVDEVSLP